MVSEAALIPAAAQTAVPAAITTGAATMTEAPTATPITKASLNARAAVFQVSRSTLG